MFSLNHNPSKSQTIAPQNQPPSFGRINSSLFEQGDGSTSLDMFNSIDGSGGGPTENWNDIELSLATSSDKSIRQVDVVDTLRKLWHKMKKLECYRCLN